jgi:integrase
VPGTAVENYKRDRLKVVKSGIVNKEVRMLKSAINRAVETKIIAANPIATIRAPKVIGSKKIDFFQIAELERVYAAGGEYTAVWKFLANTGLRRTEMSKASRDDIINAGKQTLLVFESADADDDGTSRRTKSGKKRTIPLNASALEALGSLGDDRLMPLTPNGITQAWQYMRDRANAKGDGLRIVGGVHKLRHTFVSHLVMAGIPLRTVQVLAGHGSIEQTENYAHLAPGAELAAVLAISL